VDTKGNTHAPRVFKPHPFLQGTGWLASFARAGALGVKDAPVLLLGGVVGGVSRAYLGGRGSRVGVGGGGVGVVAVPGWWSCWGGAFCGGFGGDGWGVCGAVWGWGGPGGGVGGFGGWGFFGVVGWVLLFPPPTPLHGAFRKRQARF